MSKFRLDEKLRQFEQVKRDLPTVLANSTLQFFNDSFKKQGWTDGGFKSWAKRKKETKKSQGRAVLVKSGALRRAVATSLKTKTFESIRFVVDLPYAEVHNDGGKITRKAHTRNTTSSSSVSHVGIFTGSVTQQKTHRKSGSYAVRANVADYPRRRFMGDSKELREMQKQKIEQVMQKVWQG